MILNCHIKKIVILYNCYQQMNNFDSQVSEFVIEFHVNELYISLMHSVLKHCDRNSSLMHSVLKHCDRNCSLMHSVLKHYDRNWIIKTIRICSVITVAYEVLSGVKAE